MKTGLFEYPNIFLYANECLYSCNNCTSLCLTINGTLILRDKIGNILWDNNISLNNNQLLFFDNINHTYNNMSNHNHKIMAMWENNQSLSVFTWIVSNTDSLAYPVYLWSTSYMPHFV